QTVPRYVTGQSFTRRVYDANNNLVNVPGISGTPSLTFVGGGSNGLEQFRPPVELNVIDQRHLIIGGINFLYESFDRGDTIRQINLGAEIQQMAYGGYKNGVPSQDVLWVVAGVNVFYRDPAQGPAAT